MAVRAAPLTRSEVDALQRRTVATMTLAQVFSALGNGSTLALGSILAVDLSGDEAFAGATTTALTLAPALLAVPLSGLAVRRGRRVALTTGLAGATVGTLLIVAAIVGRVFPLLVVGAFLVGLGSAVNLQARFAATDLARPERRGRDLSLVVWAVTIGAVTGPNLIAPGAALSSALRLPTEAGPFLISGAGMVIGALLLFAGLRPDPLLVRQELDSPSASATTPAASTRVARPSVRQGWAAVRESRQARGALVMLLAAHTVMVAVMSMTPLHLQHTSTDVHGGAFLTIVGFTISLHVAGMYALSPLMGWLADRYGGGRAALGGLAILLAAVATAGIGHATIPVITVGLVLLGLGWSAATVAASSLLVDAVAPVARVPAQGLSDALMSGAGALGSLGAGTAMALAGFAGLNVMAGILLLAAALYAALTLGRGRSRRVDSGPAVS
ncbi:MFS transporter [Naasia sp. SYSU D00948]|uniref:MFS transporter n=1 Tax=Naasia sp. SYSU D00948 TaxID=2817379 RepID=UPI001B30EAAE|nr:MFS transporter [Naasia sp. SYSU D00948]